MTVDIAKVCLLLQSVRDAGVEGAEYDALIDAMLDAIPELLDAYEERDRLRTLRCDCDEEEGRHAPDCVTRLPEIVEGISAEIDRLRAEVAHLNAVIDAKRDLLAAAQAEVESLTRSLAHAHAVLRSKL
jgi:hypothetical protein